MPLLLAIDDDPTVLRAFRSIFDQADVRLVTTSTAGEGLRLVDQSNPDAIILDLNLPDMSGWRRFAGSRAGRASVIFLTGVGDGHRESEAMKLGASSICSRTSMLDPWRWAAARRCSGHLRSAGWRGGRRQWSRRSRPATAAAMC